MTLGVLAAYRGRGVGTKLISTVMDHFEKHKDGTYRSFSNPRLSDDLRVPQENFPTSTR